MGVSVRPRPPPGTLAWQHQPYGLLIFSGHLSNKVFSTQEILGEGQKRRNSVTFIQHSETAMATANVDWVE